MYTLNELLTLNKNYPLNEQDVIDVNALVALLESQRDWNHPAPLDGDKVLCISPRDGEVSTNGHLEWHITGCITICVHPYNVPFVDAKGITDCSGGPWAGFLSQESFFQHATHVGKVKTRLCVWGHLGPCKNGAIDFEAEVHYWEVVDDQFYKGSERKQ